MYKSKRYDPSLLIENQKRCTKCLEIKSSDEFYKRFYRGTYRCVSECKKCTIAQSNKYRLENLDKVRARWNAWSRKNPEKNRSYRIKKLYKIDESQYREMFESQSGLCAICSKPEKDGGKLAIDHCHKTGKVRGLLCKYCNVKLVSLENEEWAIKATSYLKERS